MATAVGVAIGGGIGHGASVCRAGRRGQVSRGGAPYTRSVKVVGLYLVRNEVDIIETNLRHHLTTVLDEAIVVDNGSTDGTFELLVELAGELPLQLASETGHVYQSGRVTRMARFAAQQGADWVLPIDADEFWVALDAPFRSVLEEAPVDARALFVDVINFVQRRDVLAAHPGVVATMTMRPDARRRNGRRGLSPGTDGRSQLAGIAVRPQGRPPRRPGCLRRGRQSSLRHRGWCLHGRADLPPRAAAGALVAGAEARPRETFDRRAVIGGGRLASQALVADGPRGHARPRMGGAELRGRCHHRRRETPRARP